MEDSSRYDLPDSPRSVGWTAAEHCVVADAASPFLTESGAVLPYVEVEYETYGTPAADGNNCVLVCHALSGDAHAAGWDAHWERDNRPWRKDRPGWWDNVIGPGKGIDTNRWFVICSNVLGGCYGTTGPASVNPEYAVIGGSLGGQQTLEWALAYPDFMEKAVILASADKLSPQGLAFNTVGRHSIMSDPHFCGGDYYGKEKPDKGLAMARMLANITYLSEESFHDKFGREFQYTENPAYNFQIEYKVESYLNHQGLSFVHRFDANSYLYITKAMDYYSGRGAAPHQSRTAACQLQNRLALHPRTEPGNRQSGRRFGETGQLRSGQFKKRPRRLSAGNRSGFPHPRSVFKQGGRR